MDDDETFAPGSLVPPSWFERHPGEIPTATIVVIEAIDGEGNTSFHCLTSNHCQEWRSLGLLKAASIQAERDWWRLQEDDD